MDIQHRSEQISQDDVQINVKAQVKQPAVQSGSKTQTDQPSAQKGQTSADLAYAASCDHIQSMGKVKRIIYLVLGSFFLVLGMVGVFIPVLPTTPFLLLTAYFYLRSSYRLYCWLTGHRIFGSYINDYMQHKAIRKKAKITALAFLWSTLILSMILVPVMHLRILLTVIGIAVTIHILKLRTLR